MVGQVGLVLDDDGPGSSGVAVEVRDRPPLVGAERPRGVEHENDEVGLVTRTPRPPNPFVLDRVARFTHSGRVHQSDRNPVEVEPLLEGVARRARKCRDDRSLALEQAIEQRGLPHVRQPREDDRRSLAHETARAETRQQGAALCAHGADSGRERSGDEMRPGLVHELDGRLGAGDEVDERLAQRKDASRKGALRLRQGRACLVERACLDEIADRLRACEVEASVP